MIHDEIRNLLEAPPAGEDAPSLDAIEHMLTAGYARALALEGERLRLERRIAELAVELGNGSTEIQTAELADLSRLMTVADDKLTQLRGLLSSLRTRADEVRATV